MILSFPLRSAFLALPLTGEAKRRFAAIVENLALIGDSVRFQHVTSPHLTLQFWPELAQTELEDVLDQSQKIAAASKLFEIAVTGAGTFGSHGHDKVLFLSVHPSPELEAVKKRCPWPSDRPFAPHITLARIKHPDRFAVQKERALKLLQDVRFTVRFDRLRLYGEVERVKQTALEDFLFRRL
ncbi:MAG: RNA 2',3'-cyclic phosphodiesterase [Candidatus Peribacteraceae bacterium]|nr:RNA 2',3'-cyclic phosphodiesterase [Candidatus Peribacteraceae bacterium]